MHGPAAAAEGYRKPRKKCAIAPVRSAPDDESTAASNLPPSAIPGEYSLKKVPVKEAATIIFVAACLCNIARLCSQLRALLNQLARRLVGCGSR